VFYDFPDGFLPILKEVQYAQTYGVTKSFEKASGDGIESFCIFTCITSLHQSAKRHKRQPLEYFEKPGKAGVGIVSIQNQIDYSTPSGKFMLVMQGGSAELYSDNLSEETKKGLRERKAQGLYCGPLPFGVLKGPDGVPMRNLDTYPGLLLAFELSGLGKSNREVARALNSAGYRTVGT